MLDVDLKQKLLFICTADKISYVINISFFKKKNPACQKCGSARQWPGHPQTL